MLNELIAVTAVGGAGAFGAYWYLKFKCVLPMEASLRSSRRAFTEFTSFTRETLERAYAPEQLEHYGDLTNYYLIKLHKAFPDTSALLFEKGQGQWLLVQYLKNFKVDLATTEAIAALLPQANRPLLVSESGIHARADVERVARAGAQAILVGESLVRSGDIAAQIQTLLS
ncbi:MAG TPA: hypothetical protein PKI19_02845 [Elusimicrobiales bacterium]|nr:hypothetical protein [Elusimicrobiales bacterium]